MESKSQGIPVIRKYEHRGKIVVVKDNVEKYQGVKGIIVGLCRKDQAGDIVRVLLENDPIAKNFRLSALVFT